MPRKKEETSATDLDFESALGELGQIVDALENESLTLSDMIARYERGSLLLGSCDAFLQSARQRLEKLAIREENENVLASGGKLCQPPPPAQPEIDPDDDTISLF
jgi:exodeoxyribonuclease VII small subunit